MAVILSIETSSNGCSAAIHNNGILVANSELFAQKSSAEMLTILVSNVLQTYKTSFGAIDAVAVSKGPGSYTGLRIGVSTVKGLCYAQDLPLVAVNSLDLMIAQIPTYFEGFICPMLDARRMEVYTKLVNSKRQEVLGTSAVIVDADSFETYLAKSQVLFCGEGADKCQSVIKHKNAIFANSEIRPKASYMGSLAFEKFQKGDFENVADFEPYYLKEFVGTVAKKNKKVMAK